MINKNNTPEKNGIAVKKQLKLTEHSKYFVVYENINDNMSIEECEKMFTKLKEDGIIAKGEFADGTWTGYDFYRDCFININFQSAVPEEIILNLKKFVLTKLGLKKNVVSVAAEAVRHIKQMLISTNMLDLEYVDEFKVSIMSCNNDRYISHCREFLSFSNLENSEMYFKHIADIHVSKQRKVRDLPKYESILLFDMLIRRFIDQSNIKMRLKYYPVLLWWIISTIIPLRPSEFLILKRNCIYRKKDKYFIHIDRIKTQGIKEIHPVPIMTDFKIPENIYTFISDFAACADELDNSKYLISHNYYNTMFAKTKCKDKDKINRQEFTYIFDHFTKEIIENKYGYKIVEQGKKAQEYEIEKIRQGDTRHLAFMNMMMQGLNPLYIQRLGGHYTLNEQIHYCQHIDTFMSSKVYLLSKYLKQKNFNINFFMNEDSNTINWSAKQTEKELLGLQFYNLPKVKNGAGRCTSQNVPFDCICEECLFCQHFIPEKDISNQYIEELKKSNQQNIEIKKKLLQTLLKEQIKNEHQISIESKNLAALTNQKMIIDAYTLNLQKEDDTNE